jgi:protease-4
MMRHRTIWCTLALVALTLAAPLSARAADEPDAKTKPMLAVFTFSGQVTEAPVSEDFLFATKSESFKNLIARMKKVAKDDEVSGVVLRIRSVPVGSAQIEEIHQVLHEMRKAGKKIYAHADSVGMGSYLLMSACDRISVAPVGDLMIFGMYAESPYVRGLLDMLDVTPDFLTCGAYKSAGEMFMRKGPSKEAKEQLEAVMGGIFDTYVDLISKGRGVDAEKVKKWIDGGLYSARAAKEAGIIDAVEFHQDYVANLKKTYGDDVIFNKKYGRKKKADIDLTSPFGLLKFYADLLAGPKVTKSTKDSVAIIYVEGLILPGQSDPSGFPLPMGGMAYSTPIRKALDEAADDDKVKAVVLRIDSGGGSAVASEIILNATKRVAAKKPFVVSMGGVAGSGGYYVACGTKTIFADTSTITGSIGVVSGKFATTEAWKKAGITWSAIQRGANADMLASTTVFTDSQRELMQGWMDEVYDDFKGHVTKVRGDKLKKDIETLAGGRIYTGQQALELGLIDKIGSLDDAIQFVAKQAKLEDYEVKVLPRPKSFIELLLSDLKDGDSDNKTLSMAVRQLTPGQLSLIDAALPHLKGLDPQRMTAVLSALQRMQLLQRERVILTMPVIDIRSE